MFKEGRRIKSLHPMNALETYFMPNRNGASNIFTCEIDITETDNYIKSKRLAGLKGLGIMHVILAAYVHTVASYPGINRFIRGQKIYARNNIEICLTIKKQMSLDAQETVIKLEPERDDTLEGIYNKIVKLVEENRPEGDKNAMDSFARIFMFIPSVLLKFTIWSLKFLDYFNLLPRFITKISPFHGSMFITNVGSLGIPPVCHHLYDFGNIPLFISMGMKRTAYVTKKDGTTEKRKFIDITVVTDERICDGHYYASAFKTLKNRIESAWTLENPPLIVKNDIK